MSEHTKGRLEAFTQESFSGWYALCDQNHFEVGSGDGGFYKADARRLAACWNAFENVRTDLVELIIMQAAADAMEKLPAVQSELTAARALLREAAEAIDEFMSQGHEISGRIFSYLDACDTLEGSRDAG